MTNVVIASAARTPVGSFNGSLSSLSASDLGKVAIEAALERAGVAAEDVSEVIMGQILTAAQGQKGNRVSQTYPTTRETQACSNTAVCTLGIAINTAVDTIARMIRQASCTAPAPFE